MPFVSPRILRIPLLCAAVAGALASPKEASADPLLSPQEALAKFTVPEGFSVDLIAAEPDIVQPIAFCWDPRGRIWVVEGMTYPTRAKDGEGKDRILIFADEDGDGAFETRKVFAEGLNLVSGIELGFGGVYVGAAPYLMFIPDRDGDDKPDAPPANAKDIPTVPGLNFHAEILLDGWGWQDTHETLNSFIWGPDGWLYGCHGVFTHSLVGAPGTPKEERVPLNCAYWRFHPVKKTFEVYAHGTSNPWGFDYNENGDWFSEACVIPHFWHIIQGGYYLRQSNPLGHFNPHVYTNIETIADHLHYIGATPHAGNNVSDEAGGGHAHCGLLIYNGDNFPEEYRGRAMMFNIHGQRINQEELVPQGSGYVAKHLPDFLKANDKNFTGVALKVGPDGAVYFIDWYDMEKCHRTQPEVWDRSNGRIYRVKYDKTWKPWKGDVAKMTSSEALQMSPDDPTPRRDGWLVRMFRRIEAERRLAMSAEEKATADKAVQRSGTGDPDSDQAFLSGLFTMLWKDTAEDFIQKNADVVYEYGLDNRPQFRQASIPIIVQLAVKEDSAYQIALRAAKDDPSPRIRLAIASALQKLPLDRRWEIAEALIQHEEDAKDHNLPQMYWYAIEPLVPADTARALELAEKSKIPLVAQNIARRAAATGEQAIGHLVKALGKEKTAAGVIYLMQAALEGQRGRFMESPPKGWNGAYDNIDDILKRRPDAKGREAEILDLREALAVAFGDKRGFPRLRAQVLDTSLPADRRGTVLQTLIQGRDPGLADVLLKLLDDKAVRLPAIQALGKLTSVSKEEAERAPAEVLARYKSYDAPEKQAAVASLVARREWARALVDAIDRGVVPPAELPSFAARQIAKFGDQALTEKLAKVWGAIAVDTPDVAEEIARLKKVLTPEFLKKADLSNGRQLYDVTCGSCHVLFGQGGKLGPDLTGSNRADLDYILENIVNPNALIGKDYELHIFTLKDGRAVAGMLRGETDAAFTVLSLTGTETVVKSEVASHETPGISMMPPGQLTAFTPEQQRDLIAYLASPKQVPLPRGTYVVPGAIEGETLQVEGATAGNVRPQEMVSFPDGQWSGDEHLWWTGGKKGAELHLILPVEEDGTYDVQAVLTRAPDYATVAFSLDGKPLGDGAEIDLFGSKVTQTPPLTLGRRELKKGNHRLTVEMRDVNPSAIKSWMIGIDYLMLKKAE